MKGGQENPEEVEQITEIPKLKKTKSENIAPIKNRISLLFLNEKISSKINAKKEIDVNAM